MKYLAGLVLVLLLAPSVFAARPGAAFGITQRDLQNPIEQQTPLGATQPDHSLWITNSVDCFWDADDWLEAAFSGTWRAGETHTYTDCVVTDHVGHVVSLALPVGLTGSVTIDGVDVGTCGYSHDWGDRFDTLALPEIAGSNGGHGVVVGVAWTVTNPGHTRKATAYLRLRPSWSSQWLCP
jgi:hypothetical protein